VTYSRVRAAVAIVFVGGIAGMIVGSITDNNGIAITFGLLTAVAASYLVLATALQQPAMVRFDERQAAQLEGRIGELVELGADEDEVRELVRRAVLLGRNARPDGDRDAGRHRD
jgi:uncharacterized membrane protein YfcA